MGGYLMNVDLGTESQTNTLGFNPVGSGIIG